jgi:hypothetical protein
MLIVFVYSLICSERVAVASGCMSASLLFNVRLGEQYVMLKTTKNWRIKNDRKDG